MCACERERENDVCHPPNRLDATPQGTRHVAVEKTNFLLPSDTIGIRSTHQPADHQPLLQGSIPVPGAFWEAVSGVLRVLQGLKAQGARQVCPSRGCSPVAM